MHGGFPRFLKDAFALAKRVRADIAAGGPESRVREAAEKEARYAAFLKSRTAAYLARGGCAVAESPKKLMPMHRICDKLSGARALATTIELALATIDQNCTPQDAADVRAVAFMLTKRLRKIERHFLQHHQATMRKAFLETGGHD
jgi:hypothetical protein